MDILYARCAPCDEKSFLKKIGQNIASSKKSCTFAHSKFKGKKAMKKDIHPKNYRLVVFKDMSNEQMFMSRSTINTKDTIVWEDGKEYPLVKLEISSTSHPFYTGKMKLVDSAGRVDKFNNKYKKFYEKKETK